MTPSTRPAAAAALVAALALPAAAQETGLFVDLNKAETVAHGCRLTYVVRNATGESLLGKTIVVAVFDASGTFDRTVVFRFGGIAKDRTKVQQFDLAGQPCEEISRLLVQDITDCTTPEGAPVDCLAALVTGSSTTIGLEF